MKSNLLLILLGIGFVGYSINELSSSTKADGPKLTCPSRMDLGEQEMNSTVTTSFEMHNGGTSNLELFDFQTDCSCSGIEQEIEGHYYHLSQLILTPGESRAFRSRIAVRGEPGSSRSHRIGFKTNDPNCPSRDIELFIPKITGFSTNPTSLVFGEILKGHLKEMDFEIYNQGVSESPRISNMTISNPNLISAKINPLQEQKPPLLARVMVSFNPKTIGEINETIEFQLTTNNRSKTLTVPILATVVDPVAIYPSRIVLPRQSEQGNVFEATCLCKSYGNQPFRLIVESLPEGLEIEFPSDKEESPVQKIRIVRKSNTFAKSTNRELRIRLKARLKEEEIPLELPVEIRIPDEISP